jgi:hypothetical protein
MNTEGFNHCFELHLFNLEDVSFLVAASLRAKVISPGQRTVLQFAMSAFSLR